MGSGALFGALMNPESASPLPAWSRFRGILRLLIIAAVLAVVVLFIFPIIFEPRIDLPTGLHYGSPSSLEFRISNRNLTPLTDIAYTCEVSKLTLADASQDTKAKAIIPWKHSEDSGPPGGHRSVRDRRYRDYADQGSRI